MKNSASAVNARPRKVAVTHGGKSALRRARLDERTSEARFERALIAQRVAHLGGQEQVTEPQLSLIRHSARLELLVALAWAEVRRAGVINRAGAPSGAFQAFVTAGRELRGALETIGLERRQKPVPTIDDYINGKGADA